MWAQYESERTKPAVTQLSRRGYVTGKVAAGVKQEKPTPEPAAEAVTDAPVAESPPADEPVAEEPVAEACRRPRRPRPRSPPTEEPAE